MWKCFISEYNTDLDVYAADAFPSLDIKHDPGVLTKFPESQWKRASNKFKQLNKDYEHYHNHWRNRKIMENLGIFAPKTNAFYTSICNRDELSFIQHGSI